MGKFKERKRKVIMERWNREKIKERNGNEDMVGMRKSKERNKTDNERNRSLVILDEEVKDLGLGVKGGGPFYSFEGRGSERAWPEGERTRKEGQCGQALR